MCGLLQLRALPQEGAHTRECDGVRVHTNQDDSTTIHQFIHLGTYSSALPVLPVSRRQQLASCTLGLVSHLLHLHTTLQLKLEPTHQVVKLAKEAGFTNVHDYLVHLVTSERRASLLR
jgi:hypothetical protein